MIIFSRGFRSEAKKTIVFMLFFLSLIGCATHSPNIGYSASQCCTKELTVADFTQLSTYAVTTQDIPSFLNDMVLEEFNKAFEEKGFKSIASDADLAVTLTYQHTNLDNRQSHIDPLTPHETMNIELHYIASILVTITKSTQSEDHTILWTGKINRTHRVSPGEYMHDNNTRGAFLIAFRNLLKEFPNKKR
ncbi:MAG: hypothetical protein ACRBCS_05340 [Cellvibrionaceae bacterium]